MRQLDEPDAQLPEFQILYFSGPDSPDYRNGIKELLAEADANGIRYELRGRAMQPIASVDAVLLILSGLILSIPYQFLKSLATNLGKEAASDIWKLIRRHVSSLHRSYVASERTGKLFYISADRKLKPAPFSEFKICFGIDEGTHITAAFKTDISEASFEKAINAIIEASRLGTRQSQLRRLCQTPENFVGPVVVMFDEDIDAFVRIS